MDITQGEFKDFYGSSSTKSARSSRIGNRASSRGSMTCSMELLSPENSVSFRQNDGNLLITQTETDYSNKPTTAMLKAAVVENIEKSKRLKNHGVSSSLSDHLSSSSEDENEYPHQDTNSIADNVPSVDSKQDQSSVDANFREALKKMQKLDRILTSKLKREKEVKRQRMLYQKFFHSDLEKLQNENEGGTYSDVKSNTTKYLALLPPPQQLDVLLERSESPDAVESIFQTQVFLTRSMTDVGKDKIDKEFLETEKRRPNSSTEKHHTKDADEINAANRQKPSSAGSSKKTGSLDDKKTNFIKRNIELAKDAGNYVAMTEDEKKRLDELLGDVDDDESVPLEEGTAFTQVSILPIGEGYTPEQDDLKQLQEIDQKLQNLFSSSVYNSISSTPTVNRPILNVPSEIREVGRRIAKSSLTETLNPNQRLEEIEEKLLKLDDKWKAQFDVDGPHLSDDQLHSLLEECSRCTSPNSITTSNFSELNSINADDVQNTSSRVSFTSSRAETTQPELTSSRLSFASELTLESGRSSTYSKPPVLAKETLEELLKEARSSLGLPEPLPSINENDHTEPIYENDSFDESGSNASEGELQD